MGTKKKSAKKPALKKKVVKKKTKKSKPAPKQKTELVISVVQQPPMPTTSDLTEPMRDGRKLTVPKTWMSENQLTKILQKTPPQYVYKRPGKGGGTFEYVTVSYVQKALNYIFGWNWDFEVTQQGIEGKQVWVLGRLTVRGMREGQTIVKTQYGRADIKYKKNSNEMLDFGNDLKGATSDALKKCASMLGIASDVYGKADYKDETGKEPKNGANMPTITPGEPLQVQLKPGQVIGPDGEGVYICSDTGDIISEQEYTFSMKMFGKPLSREAQANHKPKK